MKARQDSSTEQASRDRDPQRRATGGSVALRFTIAVTSLVVLCMCVFWLISNYNYQNMLQRQADAAGQTLAEQIANQVTEPVLANDLISTRVILGQLTQTAAIAEAAVLNVNGDVIAISSTAAEPPRSLLPISTSYGEYLAPIEIEDASAGSVRIVLDLSYIEAGTGNNLIFILIAALFIAVIAIMLSSNYFQYLISFPVRLLNYAIQDIRYGEVKTCPDPETNNEIGRLIRQYNATAEFLANYTFLHAESRLSEQNLAQRQKEKLGVTATSAILCTRLANFQYLASTCDQKTLVTLLNRFYFLVENIARLYNGTISFCADGELIIDFHEGQLEDEQCFYAVCAGQLFLRLLGRVNQVKPGRSVDGKFRLAVHYGEFEAGLYSPLTGQFDNAHGMDLDIVRDICSQCPDSSLLVSEVAYRTAGGESRIMGEEYTTMEDTSQAITMLCSNALGSYRQLLDSQAEKLAGLLDEPTRDAGRG